MRRVVFLTVACAALIAGGCGSKADKAASEQVALMNDFADELKSIKTEKDLEKSKKSLEKLGERMSKAGEKVQAFNDKDSEKFFEALSEKRDDFQKAAGRVQDEMMRIMSDLGPEAMGVLEGLDSGFMGGAPRPNPSFSDNTPAPKAGPLDKEAKKFVDAELAKHWKKDGDTWTSEIPIIMTNMFSGERTQDGSYIRQIKNPKFTIMSSGVSEADKLNGLEYIGSIEFSNVPTRAYGAPDMMGQRVEGWTEWETTYQTVTINKRNGEWIVDTDEEFVMGTPATDIPK